MSAGRRLLRALQASARGAGCEVTVAGAMERPWASGTFVGAQHAIAVEGVACAKLTAWLSRLAEAGVTVPGHVVADLTVDGMVLRVLTLEG